VLDRGDRSLEADLEQLPGLLQGEVRQRAAAACAVARPVPELPPMMTMR
jgi:hypothetical protein